MSLASDHDAEFGGTDVDDAAIEALCTGDDAGDELAELAAFADELHGRGSGPVPVPSVRLAAMLAGGFATGEGDLPATAATSRSGPVVGLAGRPTGRKARRIGEVLAGLSVAARATFAASMAAASVTAAGAAGILPDPAQGAVSAAVEAVTPFSFPGTAPGDADPGGRVVTGAGDGGVDGTAVGEGAGEGEEVVRGDGDGDAGAPVVPGPGGRDGSSTADRPPAAGPAPTSVPAGRPAPPPAPADAGRQGSTSAATAGGTPAAGEPAPVGPPSTTPPAGTGNGAGTTEEPAPGEDGPAGTGVSGIAGRAPGAGGPAPPAGPP